jgi:membrane-bound lytic murein transglycosylase D
MTYKIASIMLLASVFSSFTSFAQQNTTAVQGATPDTSVIIQPEVIELPSIDSALIRPRLAALQKTIPLTYNTISHQFVEYFAFRKPSFTKAMLERKHLYFPIYEKYLAKYNLPDELKYLSLIESGLNPRAISRAKAGGLWQFMPKTAKVDFGLRIDEYVDERFSPEIATETACRYMRQLYNIFGDWELVLAAYNTGPGNVRRAIARAGGRQGFWGIYNFLPKETRAYVPQYVGILYMMHHANDHEIFAETYESPIAEDTIHVGNYLNLSKLSEFGNMSIENIQKLNPHILKDELPAWTRNFTLKLPADEMAFFKANRKMVMDSAMVRPMPVFVAMKADSVAVVQDSVYVLDGKLIRNGQVTTAAVVEDDNVEDVVLHKKPKKHYHHVRKGETLYSIADKYDVEMYDLKVWNHLRKSTIQKGQKLVVYTEQAVTRTVEYARHEPRKSKLKARYHKVHSGDTLWNIAQKYGIDSIEQLKRMNGIKSNVVRQGQKIRVS